MRKLFFIFLMAILPFHFSWSAASEYCQHEEATVAAQHFGHHFHVHQADDGDKDHPYKKNKGVHLDCSFCHVSHALIDLSSFSAPPLMKAIKQLGLDDSPLHYTSYISQSLDRPDWRFAS
ncbi:MAG: cation efflux protein, CzcI family [Pseudomonadota bacterium]